MNGVAVKNSSHVPLQVTAHLAHGFAAAQPWGIALDGILASELWSDHVASSEEPIAWPSETANPPDLPLPLARCTLAADPRLWHWAATCCQPAGGHRTEIRYRHQQLDQNAVAALGRDPLPASLPTNQGRYRSRRMPLIVTVCATVTWSAIGDPDALRGLLLPINAIGKKRGHGEGTVTSWEVTPVHRPSWEAGHLHADGSLGRPCPAECLPAQMQISHPSLTGLRPPYMHRSRQAPLYLPAFLDAV